MDIGFERIKFVYIDRLLFLRWVSLRERASHGGRERWPYLFCEGNQNTLFLPNESGAFVAEGRDGARHFVIFLIATRPAGKWMSKQKLNVFDHCFVSSIFYPPPVATLRCKSINHLFCEMRGKDYVAHRISIGTNVLHFMFSDEWPVLLS